MMKHRRGGQEDGSGGVRDEERTGGSDRFEKVDRADTTQRLQRFARGTDLGDDSVVRTLDEGVTIARVVQDQITQSIIDLRAVAERSATCGPVVAHRIERSLASLLSGQRLVGELVDLACIEAGRMVLRREPYDLAELVTDTIEGCVLPTQRRGVQIDARPTRCRLDRDRIARVIGSFLQASGTYGYPGSRIVIRVEELEHRACVSMTDVGPGLTTMQARSIFEKRQPLPGRANAVGLYVSKRIVEAHGGSVSMETIPSVGTTFGFKLPIMGDGSDHFAGSSRTTSRGDLSRRSP